MNGTNNSVATYIPVLRGVGNSALDSATGELYVAVGSAMDYVYRINVTTDTVIGTVPTGHQPLSVTFDGLDGDVYVANAISGTLSIIG